jgi:hypothetical protein
MEFQKYYYKTLYRMTGTPMGLSGLLWLYVELLDVQYKNFIQNEYKHSSESKSPHRTIYNFVQCA